MALFLVVQDTTHIFSKLKIFRKKSGSKSVAQNGSKKWSIIWTPYKRTHKWSEIFWEPRTRKRSKSNAGHESRNGIIRNPGLGQTQTITGQIFPLNSAVMSVLYIHTISGWEWPTKYWLSNWDYIEVGDFGIWFWFIDFGHSLIVIHWWIEWIDFDSLIHWFWFIDYGIWFWDIGDFRDWFSWLIFSLTRFHHQHLKLKFKFNIIYYIYYILYLTYLVGGLYCSNVK